MSRRSLEALEAVLAPSGGTDEEQELMAHAKALRDALRDLRAASEAQYKIGNVDALAFVTAGVRLSDAEYGDNEPADNDSLAEEIAGRKHREAEALRDAGRKQQPEGR